MTYLSRYTKAAQSYDSRNMMWYEIPSAIILGLSTFMALAATNVYVAERDDLKEYIGMGGSTFSALFCVITTVKVSHKLVRRALCGPRQYFTTCGKWNYLCFYPGNEVVQYCVRSQLATFVIVRTSRQRAFGERQASTG